MNIILKRGFELLKTRPVDDSIDISFLEDKYSFKIPYKYRLFAETFYLNSLNKGEFIKDVGKMSEIKLNRVTTNAKDYYFDDLFPLDFCMSSYVENDFWYEKKYMQIGGGPPDGGLLLCVSGNDSDKIIYNNGHNYEIVSFDIFDFFRNVIVEATIDSDKLKNLYKNWGENFWRLK
ncbi:MAG: hypothetical protein AAF573_22180 [Bacteroidota bacterium]